MDTDVQVGQDDIDPINASDEEFDALFNQMKKEETSNALRQEANEEERELSAEEEVAEPEAEESEEQASEVEPTPERTHEDEIERNHFNALKAERKKRQDLARQNEELARKLEALEARISEPKKQQREEMDEEEYIDPLDAINRVKSELSDDIGKVKQHLEQERLTRQEAQRQSELRRELVQAEPEIERKYEDYREALKYLVDVRVNQYKELGISEMDDIVSAIQREESNILEWADQNDRNPAETLYRLAKASGYDNYKNARLLSERSKNIQKGMSASRSLGNVSGGEPSELSIEELVSGDLDDDEFLKGFDELMRPKRKGRR